LTSPLAEARTSPIREVTMPFGHKRRKIYTSRIEKLIYPRDDYLSDRRGLV